MPNIDTQFAELMAAKYDKGQREHGPVMPLDPLEEAENECLDLANYARTAYYRIRALRGLCGDLSAAAIRSYIGASDGSPSSK